MMTTSFEKERDVHTRDLVFVDLETTGLELSKEIIEIGFIKAKAGTFEVLLEKDIKIKPERLGEADPESLKVVGYTEEEWQDAVRLKDGIREFLAYTEGTMLVGHNLVFDWMHLEAAIERSGFQPNYFYKGLDTFALAWLKFKDQPEFKKFSLDELCRHFGIDRGRAHRALDDARTTYKVFLELMK